jgi:peroxiredoxin
MPRLSLTTTLITLLTAAVLAHAADPRTVRAPLQPTAARKLAPVFKLQDASGKTVRLSDYRGKVVLLDFWATECGGCRLEIPWFTKLDLAYRNKGLAVVGVSMDILYENLKDVREAWGKVKPFVRAQQINYPILMGDDPMTKLYSIEALPATYLVDTHGRIAATYVGVVDQDNSEANIKALLLEH